MPVSGCKEPGIVARQSGEPTAGAPIKKRWLHLLRPQSPQTSSLSPSANDLQRKELSESSTKATASGISDADAIKVPSQVENSDNFADRNINMVQDKISPLELNLQEQSSAVGVSFGSDVDGGKLEVAERNTLLPVAENIHVESAPNEVLVNKQQEIKSENDIRKEGLMMRQVSTELLLAPVEPLAPDVAGQNNSRSEKEEKLNPQLWDLGLNKGRSDSKTDSVDGELKSGLCANRSNWDLNTTMERWDNLDAVHGSSVIGDSNVSESCDVKPMICSSEKVLSGTENTLVDHCKQVAITSEQAAHFFYFSPSFQRETRAEELLQLSLNTASTFSVGSIQRPSPSSSKLNLSSMSNLNPSERQEFHSSDKSISASNPVKYEPSDGIRKKDTTEAKAGNEKAMAGIVKSEPLDNYLQDSGRSSNVSNFRLTGHGAVKVEPVCGFNQETVLPTSGTSPKSELFNKGMRNTPGNGDMVPCSDSSICPTSSTMMSVPQELPTKLALSSCAVASCHSDVPTCTSATPPNEDVGLAATENVGAVGPSLVSESLSPTKNPMVDRNMLNGTEGVGVVSSETSRLIVDAGADLNGNGEEAESGEGKISFSYDMHDDCSSASDVECDGNEGVGGTNSKYKHHDGEEDDYEDGEVREPLAEISSKVDESKEIQSEQVRHGDENCSDMDISGCSGSDHAAALLHIEDKEAKSEDHAQSVVSYGAGDCEKPDQNGTSAPCSVESQLNESLPAAAIKKSIKYARRKSLDHSGMEADPKVSDPKLLSDDLSSASQGAVMGNDQSGNTSERDNVKDAKANITLHSKVEAVPSPVELTKDANNIRGNRSRIINLPRASSGPSSFGRKSIPGSRFLSSRAERERNVDVAGYENKLLPRGSRDDKLIDGAQKLERQRNQDQPIRGPGTGFVHGRGRFDKHLESSRGWESDRNFGPDNFNGASGLQFSRTKNTSGVSPAKVESNGLFVARDATIVGGGRGGRKQLNNESPTFRHPSRRRSPTGREVHISHGVQIRRPPRDSSPERCLVGSGPDVGLRHEEKFIRGPPEGMIDPMFSRHQPRYRRVGDPFVRRDRSFSPIQGRGPLHVARIRSKSPPLSRTRSPGLWSSPRRSSPDTFGQHELVHRRTSPLYRIRRMRSPNQAPCFPEDMVARRLGSPPYMAQLPSDIREHDNPRFIHRSPSGRVLQRNSRRFEMMEDHREEIDREQYFGEHMPSGRFHELRGDEVADDRRVLEGRGVVRSFRPPLIGSDIENFQFHEGGHRPFRFSPGADAEFHERSNLRVRDFERHVKNRPDNAPRRTRNIEEQEENFRHEDQEWHNATFEDVARPKRRRF
ncbi:hypothetical protein Sjap_001676 [Stephania japonica]|uniref:Uncharacterized protein n=1 Tax=Stephania japonica TaxID=461633 RepID=A0AAP0PVA1_9MAGN